MTGKGKPRMDLLPEIQELRSRLEEAEDALRAIRSGEVDALVCSSPAGDRIYTLKGADHPYRVFFESMNEGAVTMTFEGLILFCNPRFAELVSAPREEVLGMSFLDFVAEDLRHSVSALIAEVGPESRALETFLKAKGNENPAVPVSISASLLRTDDMEAACVIVTDLRVLRVMERLREANEELAAANEELRVSRDRLEASEAGLRESRAAVLEALEDAIRARRLAEETSEELRREIARRKEVEDELRRNGERLKSLYASMSEGLAMHEIVYEDGRAVDYVVADVNPAYEKITGLVRNVAVGKRASELYGTGEAPYIDIYAKVASTGESFAFEAYFPPMKRYFAISVFSPGKGKFATVFQDITVRRRAEEERETVAGFLHLANESKGTDDLIHAATDFFQRKSGCEAVGIRLRREHDYPYYETRGFPKEFVLLENSLCSRDGEGRLILDGAGNPVLECMCDNVICGRFDPSKPFFTEKGSFWTNSTTELLTSTTDADRQARTRNRCNGEGYESVALIGLRAGEERLGLLQLNDRRKGRFSPEGLSLWESLADYLAISLSRFAAGERIVRAKQEWERTFDSVPDLIAIMDNRHRVRRVNAAMARRLGRSPAECIGLPCHEVVHGTSVPPAFCPQCRTLQDGREHIEEVREERLGGDFLVSTTPMYDDKGQMIGSVHVAHDITERKRVEEELRQSRERLAWVLGITGVGTWLNKMPLGSLNWDEKTKQLFCVPAGTEPTVDLFWSRLHPDDREPTRLAVEKAVRERSLYEIDHRVVNPVTGEVRWVRSAGQATYGADGTPVRFDGINYDITEQKRGEEALRRSEGLYRAIGESIDYGIWICAPDGRNIYASESFLRLVGITQQQCSDFGWGDVLHPDDAEQTIAAWKECVRTGGTWDIEHRFRGVDGDWHPVLARGVPVHDEQGRIICWAGINLDISRLKQAEERLAYLASFPERNPNPVMEVSLDGAIRYSNPATRRLLPDLEIQGLAHPWFMHWTALAQPFRDGLTGSAQRDVTVRERTFQQSLQYFPDGRFVRIYGLDVTARRQAEEALRQSREDLDRAQAVGQIGSWRLDVLRNILTWSDENYRIFGVPKGTPLTYESFLATIHPDDRQCVDMMWNAALRGEPYDIEHRIVVDAQVKWVREKAYLEFDEEDTLIGGFGITQDITERKQAEVALRESEENLRKAREALQEANEELECRIRQRTEELRRAYRDLEKKTHDLNERLKELNCLNTVHRLLSGEGVPMASALYEVVNVIPSGWQFPETTGACVTLSGLEFKTVNYRDTPWKLQRPIRIQGAVQGSLSVVYCTERPAIDAGPFMKEEDALIGTIAELIGDFLERMRNRSMIEESEARYRRVSQQLNALLDALSDMLVLLSSDLKILWVNKAASARADLTPEALVGQTSESFWAGLGVNRDDCPAPICFQSGQRITARLEIPGSTIWDVMAIPVKDESGTVKNVILDARDITRELRLHEEAVRSARLASLGELAAGVAHEINNPINSIINYAQILANRADPPSREHEFAEEIVNEGGRIAGIVRGLLGFARDRSDVKHPVALQNILEATFVLTNAQLRRDGIKLRVIMPQDLPPIRANQQQIQQVFLNLISNARYALNKKYHGPHQDKTLDIRGESCTVEGKPHVRIEVCDHGSGIPKNIQHKVISPFFTTKPPSEGTGLGLSISHGIVADHGGRLTLESVEGEYTTVMIDLPAEAPEEAP